MRPGYGVRVRGRVRVGGGRTGSPRRPPGTAARRAAGRALLPGRWVPTRRGRKRPRRWGRRPGLWRSGLRCGRAVRRVAELRQVGRRRNLRRAGLPGDGRVERLPRMRLRGTGVRHDGRRRNRRRRAGLVLGGRRSSRALRRIRPRRFGNRPRRPVGGPVFTGPHGLRRLARLGCAAGPPAWRCRRTGLRRWPAGLRCRPGRSGVSGGRVRCRPGRVRAGGRGVCRRCGRRAAGGARAAGERGGGRDGPIGGCGSGGALGAALRWGGRRRWGGPG